LLAVHSEYLGTNNMAYGVAAIIVMREELKTDFAVLFSLVHRTVGYFVPIGAFCLGGIWAMRLFFRRNVREEKSHDVEVALALLVLLFGIWFWIFGSGGTTQVRYFVPFLYASLTCAIGATLTAVRLSPGYVRVGLYSFMTIAVLNISLLLAVPHPALAWQLISGVNVNSGSRPASLAQAQQLIASMPADAPDVSLYSFVIGLNDAMFLSTFQIHALSQPKPRLRNAAPVDWQRPSTYRIDDIVGADYLLFNPEMPTSAQIPHNINTFNEEVNAFNSWVATLTSADGVTPFARAKDSTLLRVTDRAKLRASVTALIARHEWREVFVTENPPRFWSNEAIRRELDSSPASSLEDVRFGNGLEMHGVAVKTLPGGELRLELWLSPLTDPLPSDQAIAIHALDAKGRILATNDMYLGTVEPVSTAGEFWYAHKDFRPPGGTTQIGVGVYGDRGPRDRSKTRVILAVPP
jgi:hypothetical protein